MPPLTFPFTVVRDVPTFANYHGTVQGRHVPTYCVPDGPGVAGTGTTRKFERHGKALGAIIDHCLSNKKPLRVLGAKWSLSSIIDPDQVVIDPANLNTILQIDAAWIHADYKPRLSKFTPIWAQAGTQMGTLHRKLGQLGLALRTSGASDGHRIAGCIATGTHNSAFNDGAVHDTVLAIHVILSSQRSVLLQRASRRVLTADVAAWLASELKIPTDLVSDDDLFDATVVSLGSMGVVQGVLIEAEPIYQLSGKTLALEFDDQRVWSAIQTLDTKTLFPDTRTPHHFDVIFAPYPKKGRNCAFATVLYKESAAGVPPTSPAPIPPGESRDLINFLAQLSEVLDTPLTDLILEGVIRDQLITRYPTKVIKPRFPGEIFGPTSLAPGGGTSTEIIVAHADIKRALDVIFRVLASEAASGHHLLGAVAVRFIPKTNALLGANIHAMNCYIELPSIRNAEVVALYGEVFDALATAGIAFACHWGQLQGMTPARLQTYFGSRLDRWLAARDRLIPDAEHRKVFASKLLGQLGLSR